LTGCGIPAAAVSTLQAVQRAEYAGYALASEEIGAVGPFGAYPVRVLVATVHPPENPQREALWASMLGSLAGEAADGQAIVFPGAGHGLQFERPEEVAQAIVAVVNGVGR
jgi:pimeloyl-ACP methyl ester carboxylesterase